MKKNSKVVLLLKVFIADDFFKADPGPDFYQDGDCIRITFFFYPRYVKKYVYYRYNNHGNTKLMTNFAFF